MISSPEEREILRRLAAAEARRRGLTLPQARRVPELREWLGEVSPNWHWDWRHLLHVQGLLNQVTAGIIDRLIIELPVRHGKSELITVRYPVYRLERDPALRVIVGAYNQQFASKFGRKSRRLAERRLHLAGDRTAVDDWETDEGGGYRSIGVSAGITGQGGNLIVIDDPVKNRQEAESETYRERVWEWYKDDLWTRREPGCAIIVVMSRWHEDDLIGRLLVEQGQGGEQWVRCRLPALAEEDDPLGREPGEALCPERFDEAALHTAQTVLGSYSFAGLYQQRPGPREGGFFKLAWFDYVDRVPPGARWARGWDRAATQGDGDWTAGVLMARLGTTYYVTDVVRGQWAPGTRDSIIRKTAEGDGIQVRIRGEQEPGAAGKDAALAFVALLSGFAVHIAPRSGDKEDRADPLASQAEAGNVKIVRGPWNKAFLDELTAFPTGAHDDQVDAAAYAFQELSAPVPGRPVAGGTPHTLHSYTVR